MKKRWLTRAKRLDKRKLIGFLMLIMILNMSHADVAKFIEREQVKISKVPRQFVHQPPYLSELLHKPYSQNYEVPTFSIYDG